MQADRDKIVQMLMAAKGGQMDGPPPGLPMSPQPGMPLDQGMPPGGMEMGPPPSTMPEQPVRAPAPLDNIQPPPVGVDIPSGIQAAAQRRAAPAPQDAAKDFVRSILGRGSPMPGMQ